MALEERGNLHNHVHDKGTMREEYWCDLRKPESLDELIQELHKAFSSDRVNIEQVKALLSSYRSNPKDWKKFAKFDTHR
jgi:hypothetical protein